MENGDPAHTSEVIALAWADDVSFDEIKQRLGLSEADVILVMRRNLKPSSFRLWRERVSGRHTKHLKLSRDRIKAEKKFNPSPL
jgi:uncharacterized protein (TIGR03643 family)